MRKLLEWFLNYRVYSTVALLVWSLLVWIVGPALGMAAVWARLVTIGFFVLIWLIYLGVKHWQARQASQQLDGMFRSQAESALLNATPDKRAEVQVLKERLLAAVNTIKNSKLGHTWGSTALYELPWYMVMGNPAAGKSSAVINSGLDFPFADKDGEAVQGVGGTRNCDWFFTTEGILLDTAGRYSVYAEDRQEWLGFLDLLKKYRRRAPINGIIVAASVPELVESGSVNVINLAKQLRQRVQEVTDRLGVVVPVYVVFTKTDLISGFVEFFEDADEKERSRVWGATLPYEQGPGFDAVGAFDKHFDELFEGIQEASTARLSYTREQNLSTGIISFPLEFLSVKPALHVFISTLFQENPFQHRPLFRGFYFTSALQEGVALSHSAQHIIQEFGLSGAPLPSTRVASRGGFFLRNLFSKVIFADRNLVRQYASPARNRLRLAGFAASIAVAGLVLGLWAWSFVSNQQLARNVQADLDHAVKVQANVTDIGSRLEALAILQDRLEQLEKYRDDRPLALGFGLYQGELLEAKLRREFFEGLRKVMLAPVAENLEKYLGRVTSGSLRMVQPPGMEGAQPVAASDWRPGGMDDASVTSEEVYGALKTYLMLADRNRFDASHLSDQITRFWRGWLEAHRGNASQETLIRHAEQIIGYYLSQSKAADLPLIENKLSLVDQTRGILKEQVRGTPARERVYRDIKTRANTRYPALTVARMIDAQDRDLVVGSQAVAGAFTREAWEQYVKPAIEDASHAAFDSSDWVLRTSATSDLTLEGSPEQIQKELIELYKADYVREWQAFLQGVAIAEFTDLPQAAKALNRLADAQNSPINKVLATVYRETSWDNPSMIDQGVNAAKGSLWAWFKETVLRQPVQRTNASTAVAQGMAGPAPATGVIGSQFAAVAILVVQRGDPGSSTSLMKGYLESLAKVRSRFNQILNAGETGPASRALMQTTLEGAGSELSDALKYVDDGMLAGMNDPAKSTLRPLLVRPLMQAFRVIVKPTEEELNRVWVAQVHGPWSMGVSRKYPFSESSIEALPAEIAQFLGPDGAVSKYVQGTLGALVVRRGDTITPRTWAEMGIQFNPEFLANMPRYLAPLSGMPSANPASGGGEQTTNFQLQPIPTAGLKEITVEIDGQLMRYRNGPQDWQMFSWPVATANPGTRIHGITNEGQSVEIVNYPGRFGLSKLINSAQRKKLGEGLFLMSWNNGATAVSLNFRMISGPGSGESTPQGATTLRNLTLPAKVAG